MFRASAISEAANPELTGKQCGGTHAGEDAHRVPPSVRGWGHGTLTMHSVAGAPPTVLFVHSIQEQPEWIYGVCLMSYDGDD